MLSRRHVRVKVMQAVYAHLQDPDKPMDRIEKTMLENINGFYREFIYNLFLLCKTAEYVSTDAEIQTGKFIRSEEKEAQSAQLFFNPIIQHLVVTENLYNEIEREKLHLRADTDLFRKWFNSFRESEHYKKYSAIINPLLTDDKEIVIHLFKHLCGDEEVFHAHLEDIFQTWNDDLQMIFNFVITTIESIAPGQDAFIISRSKDLREVKQFALDLLRKAVANKSITESEIAPLLKNWDKDRVAVLDMVLMQMSVTEMLFFPDIPVKVSINEYIELAKQYSTPKSGDFINGILDGVQIKLRGEERIKKSARGAIEN